MEKRLLLAIVLALGLIWLTPQLFPTPPQPKRPVAAGARADSTAAGASTAAVTGAQQAGVPTVGAVEADSAAAAVAAAARPETTTVATPKVTYRFSSVGAAPVSAVLREFHALAPDGRKTDRNVELVRPGETLVSYALVVPGDTISLDRVPFTLTPGAATGGATGAAAGDGPRELRYEASVPVGAAGGAPARVAIAYTFAPDSYVVRVRGRVEGLGERGFVLVRLPSGLRSEEADTLTDRQFLAVATKRVNRDPEGTPFGKLDSAERVLKPGPLTWVVMKNKYFILGLLTEEGDEPFVEATVVGDTVAKRALRAHVHAAAVEGLRDGAFAFEMYTGPIEFRRLQAMGRGFEDSNPYGGWLQGVVQPVAKLVMGLLLWMRDNLKINYGWVLVFFGVAVRLVMWPLNQMAMRSQIKMQRLQPELQAVQERWKSDPQKLQEEMIKVYRSHGMTPFSPFAGCLPMLLPMPVFFALYFVFQNTIEFRGVPFLWLNDISLKDPYYILPLIMGASAYLLAWIGMRNAPPNPQAKMMSYIFPAFMTFFLINFASGLNLYYAVQNIAALPQQWLITRERAKSMPAAGAAGGTAGSVASNGGSPRGASTPPPRVSVKEKAKSGKRA
ncbi:MAG TPA: membrane protein insertase YidC [Gemmatimonadaceae bacterium]|nr:membrane protein insertase YidC [Gemmatimonadaceae bacterium]